jgi:hypothetical protein
MPIMRKRVFISNRIALAAIFLLSALQAPALSQNQSTAAQLPAPPIDKSKSAAIAERLAKFQLSWGPELNSPGASITLKEISREKIKAETVVTYRIFTLGLPMSSTYTLTTAGFDYIAVPKLDGLSLDPSGEASCAGTKDSCGTPAKPNAPFDLKIVAARGEPKRFGLISRDHQFKAFTSIVPFPASATNNSCSLDAMLLTPKAEAILLLGSGFPPNSEIRIETNSAGETRFTTEKSGGNGSFSKIQLPYAEGKSNGTIRITAQSKTCAPSLDFQWGIDSYKMR